MRVGGGNGEAGSRSTRMDHQTDGRRRILFVKLTNTKGSTVESPTVVETSIVLAVENNQPSVPRLK
ncbi:hypothetical protein KSP40_PGU001291 [Platanthera guangdongensis]|uniref:Uncharacterized protein n=1 Tax=Platanthera guangdongensis TaxID=2320717 RepID=A0ABR2MNA7_9ASPA